MTTRCGWCLDSAALGDGKGGFWGSAAACEAPVATKPNEIELGDLNLNGAVERLRLRPDKLPRGLGKAAGLGKSWRMTTAENELLEALLELERSIQPSGSAGANVSFQALFARIDEAGAKLGPGIDPALRHYLQKKSYQKARMFLQGREAENQRGPCGHVE
ncbi:MAG: hypothetical protein FJ404_07745 [Verrucomicrobia bacterium]|nr:hypothetical protein [Verrucomicrobiota bacterium]